MLTTEDCWEISSRHSCGPAEDQQAPPGTCSLTEQCMLGYQRTSQEHDQDLHVSFPNPPVPHVTEEDDPRSLSETVRTESHDLCWGFHGNPFSTELFFISCRAAVHPPACRWGWCEHHREGASRRRSGPKNSSRTR